MIFARIDWLTRDKKRSSGVEIEEKQDGFPVIVSVGKF